MKPQLIFKMSLKLATPLAVSSLALTALLSAARAEVPAGYFKADNHTDVVIETASEAGVPVSYALLLRQDGKLASLYRIEELDDGTQSWVRLRQLSSGLIGTDIDDRASFTGRTIQDGGKSKLILTPVGQERDTIEAKQNNGMNWIALPSGTNSVRFESGGNKVFINQSVLSGDFMIGGQSFHGSFAIDPVIPGIGALHAQALDSESASGRSLQRNISALIAVVSRRGLFGSGDRLELIRISADDNGGDPTAGVDRN
jgi:hypothetical protein